MGPRLRSAAAGLAICALVLTACARPLPAGSSGSGPGSESTVPVATTESTPPSDPAEPASPTQPSGPAEPTGVVPAVTGPVSSLDPPRNGADQLTTKYPVTVLDDGEGAELCLGGFLASLPPQCGGPVLIGWDWAEHDGKYEEAAGVRWGDFLVVGAYDPAAGTFTPTEITSAKDWSGSIEPEGSDFSTPCPEPEGGWKVIDASTTTFDTMNEVFEAAAQLDGYAASWMDQSPNPARDPEVRATMAPEDIESSMNDPELLIVNVKVTGDPAAAEAELRAVWGGMLCVTAAARTEAELSDIMHELMESVPGVLSAGPNGVSGTVDVTVVYDDGTLQDQLTERYGPGLVRVASVLIPAS